MAKGRYTEERTHGWGYGGNSTGFGLHSGHHSSISPEQWRGGQYILGKLTGRDWEFIDIRIPRFMVMAIWPEYLTDAASNAVDEGEDPYSTPYLDLMQAAIRHFRLSAQNQEKKDCLMDWFLEQEVAGEPLSNKFADSMSTLIRLPSAQRGGAKRMLGPDLRHTG